MVTHTPYENESGMSNVPQETLRALRSFLWTHGITTTIGALSEVLRDFGPHWHDAARQIGAQVDMVPATSIEERKMLLGNGRIRLVYSDNTTSKINIIMAVRSALTIGLKDAKDYVEEATTVGVLGDLDVLATLNAKMRQFGLPAYFRME